MYFHLGYHVTLTPASNDGGIDIILEKNGITYAVQCKCHKNPSGPKDARELFGAMVGSSYHKGMLINPSGFTKGVYAFVKDKPIELIDINNLQDKAMSLSVLLTELIGVHIEGKGHVLISKKQIS